MSSGRIKGRAIARAAIMSVACMGAFSPISLSAASAAADAQAPLSARAGVSDTLTGESSGVSAENKAMIAAMDRLRESGAMGLSGKLMATMVQPAQVSMVSSASHGRLADPGQLSLRDVRTGREHTLFPLVPFEAKAGRFSLNGYRLGYWPGERNGRAGGSYTLPAGFITVTKENRDTRVSRNFRLGDFLTKDQGSVWPKYLVLDMTVVDKLELIIAELEEMGYGTRRLHVMSGFRTPQYNAGGEGRATNSRHQYGDAADIYVDDDGDGQLDDLNGDGKVNLADMRIIVEAAERVERKYPSLVGGIGGYAATSAHPPFVHVDTRGEHARWGLL